MYLFLHECTLNRSDKCLRRCNIFEVTTENEPVGKAILGLRLTKRMRQHIVNIDARQFPPPQDKSFTSLKSSCLSWASQPAFLLKTNKLEKSAENLRRRSHKSNSPARIFHSNTRAPQFLIINPRGVNCVTLISACLLQFERKQLYEEAAGLNSESIGNDNSIYGGILPQRRISVPSLLFLFAQK